MKFGVSFRIERRKAGQQKLRWLDIWRNSSVAVQHYHMPSKLRYEGKRWRVEAHWGSHRNLRKPTLYYFWNSGRKPVRRIFPKGI